MAHAELAPVAFDAQRMAALTGDRLSAEQLAALRALTGRRFEHKWRVAAALAEHSEQWRLLPDDVINKAHNNTIRQRLDYVYRTFAVATP